MSDPAFLRDSIGSSRRRWTNLLLGTALPALALAIAPGTARAQAFNGNPTVGSGTVTRTVSTGAETITVNSPSAIINWTPNDLTPIANFLPQGNVATFQNGANVANFAVLNRVIPQVGGQLIALNGTVISQLQGTAGTTRGGTVAFYTPNGLIIGSTAVFNVGNLVLTTLDPDGNFGAFSNGTGSSSLFSAINPASSITISPGAQINLTANNSFLAVLSPRIDMGGTVRVNGSTAYVGAEQANLSINAGLFNIVVATGSGDATPIVHTGSTGGPSSTGTGDNHQIAMVAIPKNQAITMLLSGSIGYDAATVAGVQNGQIFLGSGWHQPPNPQEAGPTLLNANIRFDNGGTVTSNLEARARGDITIRSLPAPFSASGDLKLLGRSSINLISQGTGASLLIGGKLQAASYSFTDGSAGNIRVAALDGGLLRVTGTSDIRADSLFIFGFPNNPPVASGGTVTLEAIGGTLDFRSNVVAAA